MKKKHKVWTEVRKKRRALLKTQRLARRLTRAWEGDVGWSYYGPRVIVYIKSWGELTRARAMLRRNLGEWHDNMNQVWGVTEKSANVSWTSKEESGVEIWWVAIPRDEVPKKPGCGFIEVAREPETVYACGLEEEG